MKFVLRAGMPVVLAASILVGESSADDSPEVAVLKGTGVRVNWLAFSADGSRLAAAMSGHKIDKNGKNVPVPGQTIVWDVDDQRQVSVCKGPKANFTYVWFSADGKTLVTVDQGTSRNASQATSHATSHEEVPVIVTGKRGYQAWDAGTGKTLGSHIAPQKLSEFSAAAVSPDGRYLAVIWNEVAMSPTPPRTAYTVGEIRVWDLQQHKVKWSLPGSSHTGPHVWSDALAFSPDGTRLAVYRSYGGPSSEAAKVTPDRRDKAFKPLKMLTLEAGKAAPTVTTLEKGGIPLPGGLAWPSDGRTLIFRSGLSFDLLDPATGRTREHFKFSVPKPPDGASAGEPAPPDRAPQEPPKRLPNGVKLPPRPPPSRFAAPKTTAEDLPENVLAPQSVLSADGTRFAIHFVYHRDKKGVMEHRIGIWDAGTQRLLGTLRLPDEEHSPLEKADRKWAWTNEVTEHLNALAISGDGKRLAVSDQLGTVRVYDTARVSGTSDVLAELTTNATKADIATIRGDFEHSLKLASQRLLESFDGQIDQQKRRGAVDAVDILKAEKSRYEKHGLVPWSAAMNHALSTYLQAIVDARAKVQTALSAADTPADFRDLIDERVVARWKQDPGDKLLVFYASGKLDEPAGSDTWTYGRNRVMTLRRKDKQAPGGFWIDKCQIESDGRKYSGTNQKNEEVWGTYVDEEK